MDTPATLLERLRLPNQEQAWERFVELYTPLLYSWARCLAFQPSDAADLVQDVFTTLVRKLPEFTYDQHKSFRGWLRTITHHKWRERRRQASASREGTAAELPDLPSLDSVDLFCEAEHRRFLVGRAMEIMQTDFQPTTWKACWELVVCGRPASEVAVELGISIGAVHAAKFRVLTRLRQELQGLMD